MARGWIACMGFVLWLSGCGGRVVVDNGGAGGTGEGGSSAAGNPQDLCKKAIAHVQSCPGFPSGTGSGAVDCTGLDTCTLQCVIQAPCGAFDMSDPGAAFALGNCIASCSSSIAGF